MGPKYLLSANELIGELRLLTHGQAVFETDLYQMVETALELALFGNTYNRAGPPSRQLQHIGFAVDDAWEIQQILDTRIKSLLTRAFGNAALFFQRELMEVRINHAGVIELRTILGQRNTPPPPPSDHDYLENIRARLEAGDWYPEKIRRLVGY